MSFGSSTGAFGLGSSGFGSGFGASTSTGFGASTGVFGASTSTGFGASTGVFGSAFTESASIFGAGTGGFGSNTDRLVSPFSGPLTNNTNKEQKDKTIPLDFSIVTPSGSHKVNYSRLKNCSSYLTQARLADACLTEAVTVTQPLRGIDHAVNFVLKQSVEPKNYLDLYEAASYLRINNITETCGPQLAPFLCKAGPEYIKKIYDLGGDIAPILEAFPTIITEFGIAEIAKFPTPLIDIILQNEKVVISPNEKRDLLSMVFDWKENPNHRLTKHLPLSLLTDEEIRHLLFHPKLNANTLRYLLLQTNSSSTAVYAFTDNMFNGILAANKDSVEFSASSVASGPKTYNPENMLTENPTEYFCTKPEKEPYFVACFSGNVEVSAYAIQVWRLSMNGVVPLAWNLEGSQDGETWTVIDSQDNQTELMEANGQTKMFEVSNPENDSFQYMRFIQKKSGNERNTSLALARFELFGKARL